MQDVRVEVPAKAVGPSDEWQDAPQWVRELLERPLSEDDLKREVVKLRLRVGQLEAYDLALSKRVFALEVTLGLQKP